jgi:hypothetical protein
VDLSCGAPGFIFDLLAPPIEIACTDADQGGVSIEADREAIPADTVANREPFTPGREHQGRRQRRAQDYR